MNELQNQQKMKIVLGISIVSLKYESWSMALVGRSPTKNMPEKGLSISPRFNMAQVNPFL
jgi:hypothetical protein